MLMTETIHTLRLKPQTAAAIKITHREQQILHLIAAGHTSKLMATQLSLSIRTVERHRANLLKKFSQKNSVTLVQSAIRHGLL